MRVFFSFRPESDCRGLVDQMTSRNHVTMEAITIIVEIFSSIPTCMQIPAKTGSIIILYKISLYMFFSIGFLGQLLFNNHFVSHRKRENLNLFSVH